jgi:hypothetical protein
MRAELPRQILPFRLRSDLAALDALKKGSREFAFSGMAFAVHRAEVEELVAEGVALFLLGEDALQGKGEFAQALGLRPCTFRRVAALVVEQFDTGEKTAPAASALIQAGHQLLTEDPRQSFQLAGLSIVFQFIARVHFVL